MTDVAYYDLHILLCHYCNYNSIAKNLSQGATEVTVSRVKMTQIFLQCTVLTKSLSGKKKSVLVMGLFPALMDLSSELVSEDTRSILLHSWHDG